MTFSEKVDVLDLIIEVLKEHEKTMDGQLAKLEEIIPDAKSYHFTTYIRNLGNSRGIYILKDTWKPANLNVGDPVDVIIRKRTPSMR